MRFVECVLCKIHHGIVDLIRRLLTDTVCNTAFDPLLLISVNEIVALRINDILLFLTHRTADVIRLSHGIAGKILHDLHDLLLVDNTAICRLQDRFQFLAGVCDALRLVFSLNVLWNEIHRSRTVQRDSGDNILQTLRF